MPTYTIEYSDDDKEWAATCDAYPSLSWLSPDPIYALQCLLDLIEDLK